MPRPSLRSPALIAVVGLAVVAIACWLFWPAGSQDAEEEESALGALQEDGSLALSAEQIEALGVRSEAAVTAEEVLLPGLAAEATPPLHASAKVVVPFAGVVTQVLADDGDTVRRGAPLLRIQSREWLAAQAELARTRSEDEAARLQAERDAALRAEGIIADARSETSRAHAAAAAAARRQAEGATARLRAVAGGQPGEYEVSAPIDGRVLRRLVAPGQALAALEETFLLGAPGGLDVTFQVPVALHAQLARGLRVRLPGGEGEVVAIAANTDRASQSLRVRARTDGDHGLVAGQHFELSLALPAPKDTISVATSALLPHGEGLVVYLREPEPGAHGAGDGQAAAAGGSRFRVVPVERIGGDERITVVRGAVPVGAQVVVRGTSALKPLLPIGE